VETKVKKRRTEKQGMSNKDFFEDGEADRLFSRNIDEFASGEKEPSIGMLCDWLEPFSGDIQTILEIGCGNGYRLSLLSNSLNADGFGVEPSRKALKHLSRTSPNLSTKVGFGDDVPFADNLFDLVHLGFYLYLVDRNKYLRCISEADRLLKFGGFLSIIDFDTPSPYSNPYAHKKGVFSHKIDNASIFVASGLYSIVNKFHFSHSNFFFDKDIDQRISLTLLFKENEIFGGC
jgi:ubiquinone/menaquinone biosynthesis C-methylase UbiE